MRPGADRSTSRVTPCLLRSVPGLEAAVFLAAVLAWAYVFCVAAQ